MRGNISSSNLWEFFENVLPVILRQNADFNPDCRLDTECNLWPNIFERECLKIGIISQELQSNRSRIKALVSRRNDIAHGKIMTIKSIEEYTKYEQAVLLIMHDLAVQVLEILENKTYKK